MKLLLFCLAIAATLACSTASHSAGLRKLAGDGDLPQVYGVFESMETSWGRWFKEYTPAECASGEPGGCSRWQVFMVIDSKGDYGWGPVYATEKSYSWTVLGSDGAPSFDDDKQAFTVWLLRENYSGKSDYDLCAAIMCRAAGKMDCSPLMAGQEQNPEIQFAMSNLTLSDSLRLERVSSTGDGEQTLMIFNDGAQSLSQPSGGKNRLAFVVTQALGEPPSIYRTPPNENWLFQEVLEGPLLFEQPPGYRVDVVRADDIKKLTVCRLKIDANRAFAESCRPLVPSVKPADKAR